MKNLFLIVFFIMLFIGIILTALSNMGGNDEMMQDIAKEYVQHLVPGKAEIETLYDMQYFPQALVNVEGVSVTRDDSAEPVFTVGTAQVAMDFWDMTMSTGKLAVLNIKELYAQAGILTQKELYLKRFGIRDEKIDNAPYLYAKGKYGGREFTARADMVRYGKSGNHRYRFETRIPIAIDSKTLKITAKLNRESGRKMVFDDLSIYQDKKEVKGNLIVQASADHSTMYIDGVLKFSDNKEISPALVIVFANDQEETEISGTIEGKALNREGVDILLALIQEVQSVVGLQKTQSARQIDWGQIKMNIALNIEAYQHKTGGTKPLTTTFSIQNGMLDLGALKQE